MVKMVKIKWDLRCLQSRGIIQSTICLWLLQVSSGLIFHPGLRHQLCDCHWPICVSGANMAARASHLVICSEQSACHQSIYHPAVEISRHNVSCAFGPPARPLVNSQQTHKLACLRPQALLQIAADKRVEHHLPCTWTGRDWTGREDEWEWGGIRGWNTPLCFCWWGSRKESKVGQRLSQMRENPQKLKS